MEQNNLTRVPLEMFSAAEVEPRDIRWLWYPLGCFLQVQIPEICRQKWRILHLRFGESCRLPGRIA